MERLVVVQRVAAPYVGIMPAPGYITRSSIQNQISELYHKRTGEQVKPYESRTADEAKRSGGTSPKWTSTCSNGSPRPTRTPWPAK